MDDFFAPLEVFQALRKRVQSHMILTGSYALYLQGVISLPEQMRDIDVIVVNATEQDIALFDNLQALSPCYKNVSDYIKAGWEVNYQFILDNVKFDIFLELRHEDPQVVQYVSFPSKDILVSVQPLMKILAVKKRMNRRKDWKVIKQIGKFIMDGYDNFINKYLEHK